MCRLKSFACSLEHQSACRQVVRGTSCPAQLLSPLSGASRNIAAVIQTVNRPHRCAILQYLKNEILASAANSLTLGVACFQCTSELLAGCIRSLKSDSFHIRHQMPAGALGYPKFCRTWLQFGGFHEPTSCYSIGHSRSRTMLKASASVLSLLGTCICSQTKKLFQDTLSWDFIVLSLCACIVSRWKCDWT